MRAVLELFRPVSASLVRPARPTNLRMGMRIPTRTPLASFHSLSPLFKPAATPNVTVHNAEELVRYKANYVRPTAEDLAPLKEAPAIYARIHVHNWSMLVTQGDIIKLPVRMRDVEVGNTLKFTECSEIGSRNHTLSGGSPENGKIDPAVFTIKGVVLEKSRVKRTIGEKTRRRRRHVRHTVSNQCLTVIRVSELALN